MVKTPDQGQAPAATPSPPRTTTSALPPARARPCSRPRSSTRGLARGGASGRGTKISYKDVHDKIVAIVEYNKIDGAVTAITTTYAYDLLDQITQVKDTKGHTTAITYDRLGRRLSIETPTPASRATPTTPTATSPPKRRRTCSRAPKKSTTSMTTTASSPSTTPTPLTWSMSTARRRGRQKARQPRRPRQESH